MQCVLPWGGCNLCYVQLIAVTDISECCFVLCSLFYCNLEAFMCAAFESKTNFPMGTIKYIEWYVIYL